MKKRILFILVLVLFCSFCARNVLASELCSKNGYTISTVNGIFTDEEGARNNERLLKVLLKDTYKNQKLDYQYFFNPTHLAGMGDLFEVVAQGFFDQKSDYDLVEMLNDASQKVTTQKVLLVAHSQGNFYANNFYDKVASQEGGVPSKSIGVYGVATPASRVAGDGKYLTSDTDGIIASLVGGTFKRNILLPNTHIAFQNSDDKNGHDFSKIYLKYQGDKIIADIKSALNNLKENDEQISSDPCISPPKLTLLHKVQGLALAVADPTAIVVKGGVVATYNAGVYVRDGVSNVGLAIGNFIHNTSLAFGNMVGGLLANVSSSLPDGSSLATGLAGLSDSTNDSPLEEYPSGGGGKIIHPDASATPQEGNQATAVDLADDENAPGAITTEPTLPPETNTEENTENSDATQNPSATLLLGTGGVAASPTPDPIVPPVVKEIPPVIPPPPALPVLTTFTIDKDTTLPAGEYNYDNLIITNNAVLTLEGDSASLNSFKGVKITAVNITIDLGASISANGTGFGADKGPGASSDNYTGASYGGLSYSSASYSKTYGSATKPTDLGSGGVNYSGNRAGGGAIRIMVSDTFTNNGTITSNGYPSSSGGSIYISTNTMTGSGKFNANGGALYDNGYTKSPGGGGRIAIYYKTSSFNGTAEAKGGCGQYDGMTMSCGQNGTVGIFDETSNDLYLNGSWKFLQADAPFSFNNIFVSNGAQITSENGVSITANNLSFNKNSSFALADNQILNIPTITLDGGSTMTLSGNETITTNSLTLNGNSTIITAPGKILSLNIPNITINSGSYISADGKGYGESAGPGAPTAIYDPNNPGTYYAGASYGGLGNGSAKPTYGSVTQPVDFGSGGNGSYSAGGGAIRLISTGNFINNGIISANGSTTSSGGSIYITANTLGGSGTFRANGGGPVCPSGCYGPGGGGRVAIYYSNSSFTGKAVASGVNSGAGNSEDGTVKMINTSIPVPSSAKAITAFSFTNLTPNVAGTIDETNHTISLTVPFGTNVANLIPTIAISDKAKISPDNNVTQNFSTPVTYTVTAEDISTQNYIVTVAVASNPNPQVDSIITQLKIITSPQTVDADTASSIITVESQNTSGVSTKAISTIHVNLLSSSETGMFTTASASDNTCDTTGWKTPLTIPIASGSAHRSFCYKDGTPGISIITISANGLSSDSQTFTINSNVSDDSLPN